MHISVYIRKQFNSSVPPFTEFFFFFSDEKALNFNFDFPYIKIKGFIINSTFTNVNVILCLNDHKGKQLINLVFCVFVL